MNGTRWQGSYDLLSDAAEDIAGILDAVADGQLDVSRQVQAWLVGELEMIECVLAEQLDAEQVSEPSRKREPRQPQARLRPSNALSAEA